MTIADCEKQMGEIEEKDPQLCKKKKVLEAISVLKELNKKFLENEAKKQPLLDEATDSSIFLQITMKKIPPKKLIKRIRVPLPQSMATNTTEVCLFTGDLDKKNKKAEIDSDVLHYKELLKGQGITKVTEVITLRQLRTEYKVYEAKRQLMAAYDVFLTDKKIAQCLPRLLGKAFIKKRKFPIQINMNTSNLKSQIDKALSETVFAVTCRGNSCTSEVARLGMENDQILENVLASVKVIAEQLPGEQDNIFGIYIKTAKSPAIPIFMSFGNPNEVKIQKPRIREKVKLEELSTLPDAKVKVFTDGRIVLKKTRGTEGSTKGVSKRKRKNNEDLNEDNLEGETAIPSEESDSVVEDIKDVTNGSKSKKKRKLNEKNSAQESLESDFTSLGATEFSVEVLEKDASLSKTKSKRKSKAAQDLGSVEPEDSIKASQKKSEVKSESVAEDVEENAGLRKTKSKRKSKAAHNLESVEPEDTTKASIKKLKVKAESVVGDAGGDTDESVPKKKRKWYEKNIAEEAVESGLAAALAVEMGTRLSKTKSGRKSKAFAENEAAQSVDSLEPEFSDKATSKKLKAKSEIENTEEDTKVIKTTLRSKGSNLNRSSLKVENTPKKGLKKFKLK